MQIQSLRYFIKLAEAGSFYRAAKSAFISQQGLNRAVTSLEDEMDVVLVERSRRGVRLTREGELFLRHARRIVDEYDLFARELFDQRRAAGQEGDPIALHVSYYAAQIAASNPGYVQLVAANSSYIEGPYDKLIKLAETSDGSDLVFVDLHGPMLDEVRGRSDLSFEPIIATRMGVAFKQGSPIANDPLLHRDVVCRLPLARDTNREMAHFTDWLFEENPLEDVRLGAANPRMLLEFVQGSQSGAALFDAFSFFLARKNDPKLVEGLRFTPLSTPKSVMQVGFVYPRHVHLTARAHHVVNVLKGYLEQNCASYFERYPAE